MAQSKCDSLKWNIYDLVTAIAKDSHFKGDTVSYDK